MKRGPARSLRIAAFDVLDDHVVVADTVVPVVIELDADRRVTATRTWALDSALRGRPTATDVVLTPTAIVVSSPAAGGVIRIDRSNGATSLVRLPAGISWLRADDERIWAVANRHWPSKESLAGKPRRPVIWEEPTAEDFARYRQRLVWVPGSDHLVPLGEVERSERPVPDWRAMPDDFADVIDLPSLVWRLDGGDATAVDVGGVIADLVAMDGRLVVVTQLPTDPLIKRVLPGGPLALIRPATVLWGTVSDLRPIGAVSERYGGALCSHDESVWLLGFNRDRHGRVDNRFEVRSVDFRSGEMSPPEVVEGEVVAVVGGRRVRLQLHGPDEAEWSVDGEPPARARELRVEGGDEVVVASAGVETPPVVDAATAWFHCRDRPLLLSLDVATGTIEEVAIDVDVTRFVPAVAPPQGVDLDRYERGELEHLRGSFFGGLRTREGELLPYIEGVMFEAVELEGEFPDSAIVARFRADERPGFRFARRWNLYDFLGNVTPVYSADLELMEDIEASGYGLPPLVHCRPDEDGIVWF